MRVTARSRRSTRTTRRPAGCWRSPTSWLERWTRPGEIYEESLAQEPDDPVAKHMLAACSGADDARAGLQRVRGDAFDGFAANFEARLAQLDYRAPASSSALLASSGVRRGEGARRADAGCGTGLCGTLPRAVCTAADRASTSRPACCAGARQKRVYDELVKAELTEYLRAHPGALRRGRLG